MRRPFDASCPYGFRIVGPTTGTRRCVAAGRAWEAYLACAPQAEVTSEAYLSAFTFGEDFRRHLAATGSTAGFAGVCAAPFVWWDIDRTGDFAAAQADAARLCVALVEGFNLDDGDVLAFVSGGKGFHVGLPTSLWHPAPSATFHRTARAFAQAVAAGAGVVIDAGVYDRVRAFRAPNSRHPKSGLHKRQVTLDALMHLSADAILAAAREPAPVEWDAPDGTRDEAARLWERCAAQVDAQVRAHPAHNATAAGSLNRQTLAFIRDGAPAGERQTRLYSAAANLRDHGAPAVLAHALLTEAALDSGLPPSEVRRTIECAYGPTPASPATAQGVSHAA